MGRPNALLAACLVLSLAACASPGDERPDPDLPVVEISGFIVRNALVFAVTDVLVEGGGDPLTGSHLADILEEFHFGKDSRPSRQVVSGGRPGSVRRWPPVRPADAAPT